jgi:hypothetical protein
MVPVGTGEIPIERMTFTWEHVSDELRVDLG